MNKDNCVNIKDKVPLGVYCVLDWDVIVTNYLENPVENSQANSWKT